MSTAPNTLSTEALVRTRKEKMSPTYNTFQTFKDPVVIDRASMQYCYGPNGQKYLDLLASNLTISVGHAHPRVVAAAKAQLDKLPHLSSMYYSEPVARCAPKRRSYSVLFIEPTEPSFIFPRTFVFGV